MKIRYILALALVAMFAIPGTASQFSALGASSAPVAHPAGSTGGLFDDPDGEPRLSLTLPTRFVAIDTAADPALPFSRSR